MKALSLPLVMTGFLVMPVSAEMNTPTHRQVGTAVTVSNQVPLGGGAIVAFSGDARPGETEVLLRLEEELSPREKQPGDVFYAEIIEDVLAVNGLVLVPLGNRARGHLSANGHRESAEVHLVIDALIVDDREIPVTARVVETNPHFESAQTATEAVTRVATGTALGAVIGRLVGGDANGAMYGGVHGAAVGTGVALLHHGTFPVWAAGSRVVVLVEEEALMPRCR